MSENISDDPLLKPSVATPTEPSTVAPEVPQSPTSSLSSEIPTSAATEAASPQSPTPASSPAASRGKKKKRLSRSTVQIRTLMNHTGKSYAEIKAIFLAAGIWKPKYRFLSSINAEEALKALSLTELPPAPKERAIENRSIQTEDAALAEAMASGKFIAPLPKGSGSGNISDDPVPQAILDGDFQETVDCFPYPDPLNIPADLIVSAINNSPGQVAEAHRQARINIGWRWIDINATTLLNRLYPDSRWRRMTVDANGRLTYKDLALACFPRAAWERRKALQRATTPERIAAVKESFASNIQDAQRTLHDKHRLRGDQHIQPIIEDADTSKERADFETAKGAGIDPRKPRVGLGRASTSTR